MDVNSVPNPKSYKGKLSKQPWQTAKLHEIVQSWLLRFLYIYIPSGKLSHNYGRSQFLMGKSTISMALLIAFCMFTRPGICFSKQWSNIIQLGESFSSVHSKINGSASNE